MKPAYPVGNPYDHPTPGLSQAHREKKKFLRECSHPDSTTVVSYVSSADYEGIGGMFVDDETKDSSFSVDWVAKGFILLVYSGPRTSGFHAVKIEQH